MRSSSRVSEPRESGSVLFKITLLLCLSYEFMSVALDGQDGKRLQLEYMWADVFNLNSFVVEKMTKVDHALFSL